MKVKESLKVKKPVLPSRDVKTIVKSLLGLSHRILETRKPAQGLPDGL